VAPKPRQQTHARFLRQQLLDQVLHIIEQARPLVEAVAR
jgi:hypothetical protein